MKLSGDEIDRHVREAAHFVGLSDELFERSPLELSGGQKRRIAIAGVIAMGQADIASELEALDANKKYVAVLCQDGVKLFTQSMTQTGTGQNTAGVKDIAARARGDVLLISSAFAEIRSF